MVFNQDAFRLVSRSDVGDSVSILHQGRTILFVSREVAKTYQGKRNIGRACQFGGQKVSQSVPAAARNRFRPVTSILLEIGKPSGSRVYRMHMVIMKPPPFDFDADV